MSHVVKNTKYKILTPSGFRPFIGMKSLNKSEYYNITLSNNKSIKSSIDHPFISNSEIIVAKDLKIGDTLDSRNGIVTIVDIKKCEEDIALYDILEVDGGNIFDVNGIVSHNCDFASSGNTFVDPTVIQWYHDTHVAEPIERRLADKNYWIWEYPDPFKYYMVVADVARGDGGDYSAFHVIDIETVSQVAEYKSQLGTRDYAKILVTAAREYNNALLVIEHASIGWDVIQSVLEMQYENLYYSQRGEHNMSMDTYIDRYDRGTGLVPGFSTNMVTRPLILEKMRAYLESKSATIRSLRFLEELRVFIWKNNKPQAMQGYNDDLVMPFAIAMFLRETSLKFKKTMQDLSYSSLNSFNKVGNSSGFEVYTPNTANNYNPWAMEIQTGQGTQQENLNWLI